MGQKRNNRKLYLHSLTLSNFATFRNDTVTFHPGKNAIVGETGSGKSLILDALELIFGHRADRKIIRKDADSATVEAVFRCADDGIRQFLDQEGFPLSLDSEDIVIKRIIYKNESTKSYLNLQNCGLQTLQGFAKRYIDLVGQFENQKLLSENYQLVLLDTYAGISADVHHYHSVYDKIRDVDSQIETLKGNSTHREQRMDYLRFQVSEIETLDPSPEDENRLLHAKASLLNKEKREETRQRLLSLLSEGDSNAVSLLGPAIRTVETHSSLFPDTLATKLRDALGLIQDVSFSLSRDDSASERDLDIDSIIEKLDKYQRLKRKFGPTTSDIVQHLTELRRELHDLDQIDQRIAELRKTYDTLTNEAYHLARALHEKRNHSAVDLSRLLTDAIRKLRMEGATASIYLQEREDLNRNGISSIQFLVETNKGEGHFKVKEIASGGELSRILLAIRQILSVSDSISIFLFDEIDTGIGGETALRIGQALKEVSTHSQVIAITHLPQIASYADQLLIVSKETEEERTYSAIRHIEGNAIAREVRDMIPLNESRRQP